MGFLLASSVIYVLFVFLPKPKEPELPKFNYKETADYINRSAQE